MKYIYLYIDDEYPDTPTLCKRGADEAIQYVKEHEGDCEGGHAAIRLDLETGDCKSFAYCQDGEFSIHNPPI
ncbi:MAG: hypothetical protein GTN99_02745 [Candidatus Dadabacteria bacterium]|nr:hypothetical protein [Candidatus Dadabacteria bacterium]